MPKLLPKPKPKTVTASKAAELLGCRSGAHHIRDLIRMGKLEAIKVEDPEGIHGFHYEISMEEIERYKKLTFSRGWKRGKKRN